MQTIEEGDDWVGRHESYLAQDKLVFKDLDKFLKAARLMPINF